LQEFPHDNTFSGFAQMAKVPGLTSGRCLSLALGIMADDGDLQRAFMPSGSIRFPGTRGRGAI